MVNKVQKVLLVGGSISDFGEGMLGPLFALFAQKIGGDILQISWASALYLLVVGILTIIVGKYSDKWSKEKMMIWGYSLSAIFTFSYILVSSPLHLFIVQVGLGIATALAMPTWNALYSEWSENKKHGSSWGWASGLSRIIGGVSIVVGGFLVNFFSFNTLFIIMGTIQAMATIYQAKIIYMNKKEIKGNLWK